MTDVSASLIPDGFVSEFVATNGINLHVVHNVGEGERRPLLFCLHGFPEFWFAWSAIMDRLGAEFAMVVPDQRGFNLSDAPSGTEAYRTGQMVRDLDGLTGHFAGGRAVALAGHDWGASVAYAAAIGLPQRFCRLIIANGVHPVCFQRAIFDDPQQRQASQYFHRLTAPGAAERMLENGAARSFSMFEKFSASPWLTPAMREAYLEAWSRPGRMEAMLNWYRSSPVLVPLPGEEPDRTNPLYQGGPDRFAIRLPHLLVWGEADEALRPSSIEGLGAFAPELTVRRLANAGHWLLHTHADAVAGEIRRFLLA